MNDAKHFVKTNDSLQGKYLKEQGDKIKRSENYFKESLRPEQLRLLAKKKARAKAFVLNGNLILDEYSVLDKLKDKLEEKRNLRRLGKTSKYYDSLYKHQKKLSNELEEISKRNKGSYDASILDDVENFNKKRAEYINSMTSKQKRGFRRQEKLGGYNPYETE